MFSGMAKQLLPGGAVLVITRHQQPDLPLSLVRAKEVGVLTRRTLEACQHRGTP